MPARSKERATQPILRSLRDCAAEISFNRNFLECERHIDPLRSLDQLHDVIERQPEHEHASNDHYLSRIVACCIWIEKQGPEVELSRDEPKKAGNSHDGQAKDRFACY